MGISFFFIFIEQTKRDLETKWIKIAIRKIEIIVTRRIIRNEGKFNNIFISNIENQIIINYWKIKETMGIKRIREIKIVDWEW